MVVQKQAESYETLLDNVLRIRLKYLATLSSVFLWVPAVFLCKFSLKLYLSGYSLLVTFIGGLIFHRFYFLKQSVNYNNINCSYFNYKNLFSLNFQSISYLILNVLFNLTFFIFIDLNYFCLNLFNKASKHQLRTINDQFIYYYLYSILIGVFNTGFSLWFNENVVNINFTRFHITSKSLLQNYLQIDNLVKILINYSTSLLGFIIGLQFSIHFFNINQFISNWLNLIISIESSSSFTSLRFSPFFYLKLIFFSIFLKSITYLVCYCFFNSYILLGSLHFGQLISNYSNNKNNFEILFNSLDKNDKLINITILQELGHLSVTNQSLFCSKIFDFYQNFNNNVERILRINIENLNKKMTKNDGKKNEKKTTPTKINNRTILKNISNPNNLENKINNKYNLQIKENNDEIFKKSKNSFFWSILNSISVKFIMILQDQNFTESYYIINLIKVQLLKLISILKNLQLIFLEYLNIDNNQNNFDLVDSIEFYYYLSTFSLIIKDSSVDGKLNNKILSNIINVLTILQQSIEFCEDYMKFNNIKYLEEKHNYFRVQNFNPIFNQYNNQYLVFRLHLLLIKCFTNLVIKYDDILNELNLNEKVLKLSNRCLTDFDLNNKMSSKLHENNNNDYTIIDYGI